MQKTDTGENMEEVRINHEARSAIDEDKADSVFDEDGKIRIGFVVRGWASEALPLAVPSLLLGILTHAGNSKWHQWISDSINEKYAPSTSLLILTYSLFAILATLPITAILNKRSKDHSNATRFVEWMVFKPLFIATKYMIITVVAAFCFDVGRGVVTVQYILGMLLTLAYIALIYGYVIGAAYFSCVRVWRNGGPKKKGDRWIFWVTYLFITAVTAVGFVCDYVVQTTCAICQSLHFFHENTLGFSITGGVMLCIGFALIQWQSRK
ncbi:hypothetical protein F4827_001444 [Paraburkholderia bannensis]|uniref:Uncharacterized protein n=1 Tax=Paraburkholderia bannensis TaxID=765414 RepID=A0A7W9WQ10_9BURK|nr:MULTISPECIES: hypothetical protein [Paraburkholderia]MBB3256611.1 hypothetical protein [Paraburkholderia sp. WP4_3_2]MBB6101610.1 hypothetical protein [Paraburkholderia bannensis]